MSPPKRRRSDSSVVNDNANGNANVNGNGNGRISNGNRYKIAKNAKAKIQSRFLKTFQLSLIMLVGFAIITTYSLSKYVMKQVDNHEESFGSGNDGEPIHLKQDHIGTTPTSNSNKDIDVDLDGGGGSACLLIKDDNSRLIEWLAYHYTMLPLRHLIVAVDPDSKTTPHSILKRWNTIGLDENEKKLNYIIWDDNDYMDPFTIMKRTQAHEHQLDITMDDTTNLITAGGVLSPQNLTSLYVNIHRDRQRQFLSNCYRHHKLMNHTWVMHIDTDEYIVFNTIPGIDDASAITKNSILKSNIKIDNDEPTKDEFGTKIYPKVGRITLPKLGRGLVDIDNKTILDVLAKRTKNIVSPCMGMIRLLFGDKLASIPSKDDFYNNNNNNKTTVAKSIFDLNSFDTLKFNYHHQKGLYEPKPKINGIGKVIVDVSQMSYKDMDAKQLFSIHRPLLLECPSEMIGPRAYVDSLFRVNHYLGSWEAYKERNDIRRSRDVFNYRANTGTGLPSYDIRPWLEDFINHVGQENARRLLKGIGEPFSASTSTSLTSSKRTKKEKNKSKAATAVAATKITTPITTDIGWPPKRTCALLFFGIGRKFKDISYPSIKTNILDINPDCDIFVHTYDIKKAHGSREGEGDGSGEGSGESVGSDSSSSSINAEELFLLVTNGNYNSSINSTDNHINDQQQAILDGKIIFETEDDFERQRDYKKYRDYFPNPSAWEYPTSMDNMIRQWHSIAGVWKLMRIKETQNHHRYDRVGLFRPDVLYTHPINIMGADDENGKYEQAVIPSMMYTCTLWCGYNDRMFYGDRMYADIWSSTRFDTVDTYLKYQKNHSKIKGHYYEELSGIHSEDFLRFIFEIKYNNIIPLTIKDICFQRVRSNGLINQDDCELIQNITYPNTTKTMMMTTTTTAKTIVAENKNTDTEEEKEIIFNIPNNAPGLIVLGMHRSGTSLLTGVLSKVFHWHVPGDHVFANITSQNPKGFFENIDIARQNDAWLEEQDMSWDELGMYTSKDNSSIVYGGLDFSKIGPLNTNGKGALIEYKNIKNRPWALKDPRLCIILSKWLSLLKEEEKDSPPPPPILFTYRNPMDSARSLGARKRNPVPMLKGFKLWIWYNREAIRLSNGLCRVITSNDALLADANNEIARIENELSICGLKAVIKPHYDEVDKFINPDFQHGSDKHRNKNRNVAVDDKMLCKIPPYQSPTIDASKLLQSTEKIFYYKAMNVFCDMKSGKAFLNDYIWPTIPKDNTD